MPAAPATQPSPKSGTRLTLGRKPTRVISRASIVGTAIPVLETITIVSTSSGAMPAALSAERMAFEATFRHTDPDGTEWIYHLGLHGEATAGLDLSNAVDQDHLSYEQRCKEPGWEELRPVLMLVPRPIRPVLEAWARDGAVPEDRFPATSHPTRTAPPNSASPREQSERRH